MSPQEIPRHHVRQRPPEERIKDFFEVALGYDEETARKEAVRCLQCRNKPCVGGCPVGIDIPVFIKLLAEGKTQEALAKIKEKNFLPAVCGRVCPQEDQCEKMCVLSGKKKPINIGALERFAADLGKIAGSPGHPFGPVQDRKVTGQEQRLSAKVAVVGSGPAGLTAAADLAERGYRVTLFESLHLAGGVLSYGIPEFRLPKKIVDEEVGYIRSLGVEIRQNVLVGRTLTIEELFRDGYKAVFLAAGAGLPNLLGIEGENSAGVYFANEFLTRVNLMKAYRFPAYATPVKVGKKVAVVGGGNVALDSARAARRLGAEVIVVYRRSEQEMPARKDEVENAKEEGIRFEFLASPKKIVTDAAGKVRGLECSRMKLGEPDDSGRPRPVVVLGSDFTVEADSLIVAAGQSPNPLLAKTTPGLEATKAQTIRVDEHFMTSIKGVFAGGDITTGADTVISAMGAGKRAAEEIDNYLFTVHPSTTLGAGGPQTTDRKNQSTDHSPPSTDRGKMESLGRSDF